MPASRRLRLSAPARRDLDQIGTYTRRTWGDAQAAAYGNELRRGLQRLAEYPELGPLRPEFGEAMRSHPIRAHVVFYKVDAERISIVRILHASMDPPQHIARDDT